MCNVSSVSRILFVIYLTIMMIQMMIHIIIKRRSYLLISRGFGDFLFQQVFVLVLFVFYSITIIIIMIIIIIIKEEEEVTFLSREVSEDNCLLRVSLDIPSC